MEVVGCGGLEIVNKGHTEDTERGGLQLPAKSVVS
jgi:hypothetical protein